MKFAAAAKTKLILLIGLLLLGARAQKEEPEYATETERKFDYINAFLTGFKSQETLPSAQNCSMYLEQSIEVFNSTKLSWKNDTTTENWGNMDYILNTTSWISFSLAPSSRYCFTSVLEMYKWYLVKDEQFEGFGDVFAAWLQNLLGNVITFNSLYKKINEANEAENMREVYYWYGRFFTLFINFEPIEDDTLDDLDDFDDGGFFATDKSIYSFGLGL